MSPHESVPWHLLIALALLPVGAAAQQGLGGGRPLLRAPDGRSVRYSSSAVKRSCAGSSSWRTFLKIGAARS